MGNQPKSPSGATTISPQRQLWNQTTTDQQLQLAPLLRRIKKPYQEDLCLGLVAYLRFGIYRPFDDPVMQMLFKQCITIVTNY